MTQSSLLQIILPLGVLAQLPVFFPYGLMNSRAHSFSLYSVDGAYRSQHYSLKEFRLVGPLAELEGLNISHEGKFFFRHDLRHGVLLWVCGQKIKKKKFFFCLLASFPPKNVLYFLTKSLTASLSHFYPKKEA